MSTNIQRPTRRGVLIAGGALTVASAAAAAGVALQDGTSNDLDTHGVKFHRGAGTSDPEESVPSDPDSPDRFDPDQRYLQLVGGGNGVLYGIQADGKLTWHRHTGWEQNNGQWATGSGRVISAGWHQYRTVMGAEDGSLFALRGDGSIVHKRYLLTDSDSGAGIWSGEEEVGAGFERFEHVFGYDGLIYGIGESRTLHGFAYDQAQKRITGGKEIGRDFNGTHYGADTDGVIYTYFDNSTLIFRHTGEGKWAGAGHWTAISRGNYDLAEFSTMIFAGAGRIYYVAPSDPHRAHDGNLQLHRLTNYVTASVDDRADWATTAPVPVANGFTVGGQANLQGYTIQRTVPVGGTVSTAISTTFTEIKASIVRLAPSGAGPDVVQAPVKVPGTLQNLPNGYVINGCGWAESFQAAISPDWPSGVYAVRLTGPRGLTRNLPFVVRPAQPAQQVAVIIPTNTYMAYNTYGGHSQYCSCKYMMRSPRLLSFHRPLNYEPTQQGGRFNATLFADLLMLRWMTTNNYTYDVYSDDDLDRDPDLIKTYRVVVLPSHPEYYSERQRAHLLAYQQAGGHTLYLGGNGIYERVTFTADRSALHFRKQNGQRDVFGALGMPASQLLGTNWNFTNYWTFAPYQVLKDHPLLAGTGLKPGATFGMNGVNGPASGCEVDCRMGQAHEVAEEDIFARGQNPKRGAEMLLRKEPNGGSTFSVGSQAFTGALFTSAALSTIVRNAFNSALGRSG